jgi:hypothetical protein
MQSPDKNSDRKPVSNMKKRQDLLDTTTKTVSLPDAIRLKETARQALAIVTGINVRASGTAQTNNEGHTSNVMGQTPATQSSTPPTFIQTTPITSNSTGNNQAPGPIVK